MTNKEQIAATDAMRAMSQEEMLKVDPSDYMGEEDDVDFSYTDYDKARLPIPIIETEDEEFMARYIAQWIDDLPDIQINSY